MTLRDAGENALLARLLPTLARGKGVVVSAGDDCAVLRSADKRRFHLLKTDCIVEDVHFEKGARGADIGWKAMARALSDFAAMSGVPRFALITLIAPATTRFDRVLDLYRGLNKAATRFDVGIVGGETSSTSGPLALSVSLLGDVERDRCVLRSGGRAGDQLFVTGQLGGTLGGKHLRFVPRIVESRWLSQNFEVHAMMDLSDGLGADLPRLATASGVGFEIDEQALPRSRSCTIAQAINDGEDYELLFAISRRDAPSLQQKWRARFPALPLTCIGLFKRNSTTANRKSVGGYEHFRKR
jgi:thiamine-monophosphate kinase